MKYLLIVLLVLLVILWVIVNLAKQLRGCVPVFPKPKPKIDDCMHRVWIGGDEGYFKSTVINIDGACCCALCHEVVNDGKA